MKVTGYRTWAVQVPMTDQAVVATMSTYVLLQVQTDEGVDGIAYASRITPAYVRPFITTLEGFLDTLVGRDPLAIESIVTPVVGVAASTSIFRRGGSWPGYQARIASAVDVALWDIRGKVTGQPVHRLLGGFRDRVPCYASWRIEPGTDEARDLGASARHLLERGFRAMKFHVRHLDETGLVSHLRQLRDAVGPGIDIMVDNYQGWDLKQSIRTARLLTEYDPYWIEDPMPLDDYDGMRQLRDSVDVRICAGEQYRDLVSFRRLLENRSVDIAMVDLDVGITGFLKIAHLAEAFGVPVVSHLATEVMAPCVAAVPNGLTVEYIPYAQPLFREPMQLDGGELVLPMRPGLGLEFDEKALRELAI